MRDNELKCPLAAVISVINLIKIIRSEDQKRVLEEKSSNGLRHKRTPSRGSDSGRGRYPEPISLATFGTADFVVHSVNFPALASTSLW